MSVRVLVTPWSFWPSAMRTRGSLRSFGPYAFAANA